MHRLLPLLLAFAWLLAATPAAAGDPCPQLRAQSAAADVATRIAAIACQENHAWYRTFIDADGRSGGQAVYEAENDVLADGIPAWRKVAAYWSGSGLPGDCGTAAPACRSYVVDTPWSAAFVSWVMRRAGVPGFTASARHADYVRTALRPSPRDPYRMASPIEARPEVGDLLCYVRAQSRTLGHRGLIARLENDAGLPMHCDIVVGAADGMAWLVGGNVQQAVALRMLRLDADGRFADLPLRDAANPPCSPDAPAQCNLNRQDWAALLKLDVGAPASMLAANP
ncbi:MAG: DUF2272 domain-containing protein [Luteimonas sp.]|nr:DUF2272 domain-containing protein [Luteimonas sp.]